MRRAAPARAKAAVALRSPRWAGCSSSRAIAALDAEPSAPGRGFARARFGLARWVAPRSMRSIRPICLACRAATAETGALCPPAGARCASSSGRFATGSARRSSRISATGCCRRRRSPIRRFSARPRRRAFRGRAGAPPGASVEIFRSRRTRRADGRAGWRAPAPTFWPTPTRSRRCRCIALRLWTRRFNQAAALARAIARRDRQAVRAARFCRVKATRSQVGLSREQRAAERARGVSRAAQARRLQGRRIVLVDDVLTSGATANAAARALLRGRRGAGRSARVRAGCDSDVTSHILWSRPVAAPGKDHDLAADRHLHQVDLPLLPRRQGSVAPQGRDVRGNQRRRRSRRPGGDGGQGGRSLDGAADLHRRDACRRLRRSLRSRQRRASSTRCSRAER